MKKRGFEIFGRAGQKNVHRCFQMSCITTGEALQTEESVQHE